MGSSRTVYVISDLHIGGEYARPASGTDGEPRRHDERGFRMCTRVDALRRFIEHIGPERRAGEAPVELVINGDFVDFLAEADRDGAGGRTWKPLVTSPAEAVGKLRDIVERDQGLFDALATLLARGHALTVLLGNHDVELSYPDVQAALRGHIGVTETSAFAFLTDGRPYLVGDAHIEHGNEYDGFNRIDHPRLEQARALQQAGKPTDEGPFHPPPGSRLVASIMNPIKERYPFVDLLKPETEAVLPILAAMAPRVRWKLPELLWLKAESVLRADIAADDEGAPARAVDGAADDEAPPRRARRPRRKTGRERDEEQLRALLSRRMSEAQAEAFLQKLADADEPDPEAGDDEALALRAQDIASPSLHVLRLLASIDPRGLRARLPALLDALRVVQSDRSFDEGCETDEATLEAARAVAKGGRRFVIFGHTHLAKRVPLDDGATYLNSGTWADLIAFPKEILRPNDTDAMAELALFLDDLERGELAKHICFQPSYVRLVVEGDRVRQAELHRWEG